MFNYVLITSLIIKWIFLICQVRVLLWIFQESFNACSRLSSVIFFIRLWCTSCAQVHELRRSHCGHNREDTSFSWLHIYYAHLALCFVCVMCPFCFVLCVFYIYTCIYIYICNHENNVPSRLSPQWLCGNSCNWAHDVRLYIAEEFTTEEFFEVALVALDSWPKWDLNPQPLTSFQTF